MLAHPLPTNSRERLAHDVLATSAHIPALIMLQTAGRKRAALTGRIFATFQTSIISKQDQKSGGKKAPMRD